MSGLDLNDNGRIDYTALYTKPPPSTNIRGPRDYLLKDKIKAIVLARPPKHPDHLQAVVEIRGCQPRRRSSSDDVCLLGGNVGGLLPWKRSDTTEPTASE